MGRHVLQLHLVERVPRQVCRPQLWRGPIHHLHDFQGLARSWQAGTRPGPNCLRAPPVAKRRRHRWPAGAGAVDTERNGPTAGCRDAAHACPAGTRPNRRGFDRGCRCPPQPSRPWTRASRRRRALAYSQGRLPGGQEVPRIFRRRAVGLGCLTQSRARTHHQCPRHESDKGPSSSARPTQLCACMFHPCTSAGCERAVGRALLGPEGPLCFGTQDQSFVITAEP